MVGVTGGIGAGKSTVCRLFAKRGRRVLSTDRIASTLSESDPRIRSRILRSFGPDIYHARGGLDRQRLASIVFHDPRKLRKLNSIVHPPVLRHLQKEIKTLRAGRQFPYLVVESALIFEAHLEKYFDYVIVVHAPLKTRIERVRRNSGLSRIEIRRRAKSQIRTLKARRRADFAIANGEDMKQLAKTVRFLDNLLLKSSRFSRK